MDNLYDYRKYAILYVDDEEKSLKYFTRAFGDEFRRPPLSPERWGYRFAGTTLRPMKSACC